MDTTISRRPIAATISSLAAITLTVSAMAPAPTDVHTPPVPRVVTQAVTLTANPLEQIWDVVTGVDTSHPLPVGVNPVAPIAEQVLRSVATYSGQLLSGRGQLITGEISAQVKNLQDALPAVQEFLIDDVAVIPAVTFSAFFLTALVIASLPASQQALPGLVDIWLKAVLFPPLKWVYNGFAIRNAIAMALQPPSSQPEPATAVAAASTEPTYRRASSGRGITTRAAATSSTATRAPTPKRSKPAASSSAAARAKAGIGGPQRQRQAAP